MFRIRARVHRIFIKVKLGKTSNELRTRPLDAINCYILIGATPPLNQVDFLIASQTGWGEIYLKNFTFFLWVDIPKSGETPFPVKFCVDLSAVADVTRADCCRPLTIQNRSIHHDEDLNFLYHTLVLSLTNKLEIYRRRTYQENVMVRIINSHTRSDERVWKIFD